MIAGLLLMTLLALMVGCDGAEARKARFIAKGDALMAERKYDKAPIAESVTTEGR